MAENFDEAKEALSMALEAEPGTDGDTGEIKTQQPKEAVGSEQTIEAAVSTAEAAAQAAQEKDIQLEEVVAQLAALQEQNNRLQGTIDELSRQNEEELVEEALTPPILDLNELSFADEAELSAAQADYAKRMGEYQKAVIMKELEPFMKQIKEGQAEREKAELIELLSEVPELSGMKEMMPQIENVMKNNKILADENIPLDERMVTAYAIARGARAINTPPPEHAKSPTVEDMMGFYNSNAEFREMVEKQRLNELRGQQVPIHSASSGAGGAALNVREEPKTLDEARDSLLAKFGLK